MLVQYGTQNQPILGDGVRVMFRKRFHQLQRGKVDISSPDALTFEVGFRIRPKHFVSAHVVVFDLIVFARFDH